jgi:drug/metabolite transporter (DMT)-like permease
LLYLAIPGLVIGNWFWQEGVARLGATRAGLYLYVEPIATLALAVPVLGEPFGPIAALGAALVLTGVYVGSTDKHRGAAQARLPVLGAAPSLRSGRQRE